MGVRRAGERKELAADKVLGFLAEAERRRESNWSYNAER